MAGSGGRDHDRGDLPVRSETAQPAPQRVGGPVIRDNHRDPTALIVRETVCGDQQLSRTAREQRPLPLRTQPGAPRGVCELVQGR